MAFFICKAALIFSVLAAISLASHEEKYRFGRSYTINPGKVGMKSLQSVHYQNMRSKM